LCCNIVKLCLEFFFVLIICVDKLLEVFGVFVFSRGECALQFVELSAEFIEIVSRCLIHHGQFEVVLHHIVTQISLKLMNTLFQLESIIFDLLICHRFFIIVEYRRFQFLSHLFIEMRKCYKLALMLSNFAVKVVLEDFRNHSRQMCFDCCQFLVRVVTPISHIIQSLSLPFEFIGNLIVYTSLHTFHSLFRVIVSFTHLVESVDEDLVLRVEEVTGTVRFVSRSAVHFIFS